MDAKLLAWGRAVKARQARAGVRLPAVLWLFTDAARVPDLLAAVARLPPGLAGVVLRHDGVADRTAVAAELARLCRRRRLALAIAGDWRLAASLHAGLHLRGGRRGATVPRRMRIATASAHGTADLRRARRAGAMLAFLSPAFATRSHPGAVPLGPCRWGLAARRQGSAAALGGVDGQTVRRLPQRRCVAIGAIGALL